MLGVLAGALGAGEETLGVDDVVVLESVEVVVVAVALESFR